MEVGYLDFRGGVKECGMVKITEYSFGDYSVAFACEGDSPFGEMSRLHICNVCMHFCASAQVPEFNMYDFEMAIQQFSPITQASYGRWADSVMVQRSLGPGTTAPPPPLPLSVR